MKRILLLAVSLASVVATAVAQNAPFSGEWRYKTSGELLFNVYFNGRMYRLEEPAGPNKPAIVTLITQDSTYILAPEKKTYMAVAKTAVSSGTKTDFFGLEIENISSTTTRELIGHETVEGFECAHYKIDNTNLTSTELGGVKERGWSKEVWVTPQIPCPIQEIDAEAVTKVLRKVIIGSQPAHLFTVPRDYKLVAMPANVMDMMGGQADAMREAARKYQEQQKPSQSGQQQPQQQQQSGDAKIDLQKVQDALKKLGVGGQ